jgi:alanine-glyoxylate transaminase/serine-glyoxylate transaminase/serine-pyruvate transaminase
MAQPTIDHRSPDFAALAQDVLHRVKAAFGTRGRWSSIPRQVRCLGGRAGEHLSPGDRVLAFETGEFGRLWAQLAKRLGLEVDLIDTDWRRGVDPSSSKACCARISSTIRAVLVVHNETSTGATSRLPEIRRAIDACGHPALLLVDAVSSLGSIEIRHDDWSWT